jgi:hypothetical protein
MALFFRLSLSLEGIAGGMRLPENIISQGIAIKPLCKEVWKKSILF